MRTLNVLNNSNEVSAGRRRLGALLAKSKSSQRMKKVTKSYDLTEIEKAIETLKKQYNELKKTENFLDMALTNPECRKNSFKHFQDCISSIGKRLQNRANLLQNCSKKLNSFDQRVVLHSNTEDISAYLERSVSNNRSQKELLDENKQLVEQALALERVLLMHNLKLKLNHDHRDLLDLRSLLCKMMDGSSDNSEEEQIVSNLKRTAKNIKTHIEEERKRIDYLKSPINIENEAAIVIQKLVRGYLVRKSLKK